MLVFPQWRPEIPGPVCSSQRWMPAERFAPYVARPVTLPPPPPQIEDEDSSGDSSPERVEAFEEAVCGWRACNLGFNSIARLSAHVARVHALAYSDGLFYCGWKGCARPQRGFNARYKMLVHIRTHTNERPHTCNQCNKSFSRAENLKIHLRSHSGEKPYVCPYEGCGKAYSNSSDRFKHTRTHTVDKPYCCKVSGCNKRYTDPSSLRKHVKTYKHFTVKERKDSEETSIEYSPTDSCINNQNIESSPLRVQHSPVHPMASSPTITHYQVLPISKPESISYPQMMNQITYIRPIEHIYPLRVPAQDMPYSEYTNMYEQAYRSHYQFPILRPRVSEKEYYEEQQRSDVIRQTREQEVDEFISVDDDIPLDLKCAKRMDIEEFVRRDLPLDLSTKS